VKVFGIQKPLIGVVHLLPLPGAPGYRGSLNGVIERAVADATAYLEGGLDGLIVENYGDLPYAPRRIPPETLAALTAAVREIRTLGRFPLGVNALRCDGEAALAAALAAGAEFIRVNVLSGAMLTDQGVIEGSAPALMRRRAALRASIAVWGDLLVKHAVPLAPVDPVAAALDLRDRALADALIFTGPRTGAPIDTALLRRLRRAVSGRPWVVGSGVTVESLPELWPLADAFIVATSLKSRARPAAPVAPEKVAALARQRDRIRHAGGAR
jgi:membrane complex biogenesis BtpA family protein